ncbi:dynein light chain 1, cytoplasmic [Cyclospora cayetanensis]|uniref:Dynein light chain 1, cytoplasmic n=2 Tax=Cyclospora cayetanensis TaxID=88456 RepID=A0A6P5WCF9_9EIME|nr:dynein light chain 1, cytoplasmic [Cyclospora cayetanensis]OEH75080.1 dynein light chain type [Cyclospora cayetanensis]
MFPDEVQRDEHQALQYTLYKDAKVMIPPDMPDYMLDYAIAKAKDLLEGSTGLDNQAVATALKRDMDEQWQPCWHVTVGQNFASYVVHQKRRFVYFSINKTSFLVYKAQ